MRRFRRNDRPTTRGGGALVKLANAAASATSKLEDIYWDTKLTAAVKPWLTPTGQQTIEAALERLWGVNGRAYDLLADAVEATIESTTFEQNGQTWDVLMFVVPFLAWSRNHIPSGTLRQTEMDALREQLRTHIFVPQARFCLANRLMTPDQLPTSYDEETRLARQLFGAAVDQRDVVLSSEATTELPDFVSDARFMVGAVAVPHKDPIFAWANGDFSLETVLPLWEQHGCSAIAPMLAGVQFKALLPGAFFATLRKTDRESRGFHLQAGVAYLQALLHCQASQIGATFAPFHDHGELVEYRVGLGSLPAQEIWHGITWPILSADEEDRSPGEIRQLLQAVGVTYITEHERHFPLEYSDEYGDPLFPNASGETVRAEPPEEADVAPVQLH